MTQAEKMEHIQALRLHRTSAQTLRAALATKSPARKKESDSASKTTSRANALIANLLKA